MDVGSVGLLGAPEDVAEPAIVEIDVEELLDLVKVDGFIEVPDEVVELEPDVLTGLNVVVELDVIELPKVAVDVVGLELEEVLDMLLLMVVLPLVEPPVAVPVLELLFDVV